MEKSIPCKQKSKESQGSNNCIGQNKLENKDCNKRQRRTYQNDQGVNPRRYDINICACTTGTIRNKVNINKHKGRN